MSFSLVLISKSPRRRLILESLGLNFRTLDPRVEEIETAKKPSRLAIQNAILKMEVILKKLSNQEVGISADTIVNLKNVILGKPKNVEEARSMLQLLSGKTHEVITGLCVGWKGKTLTSHHTTKVTFKRILAAELELYLQTPEPFDKAGAYAVQGLASLWIREMEGSYTNVMGLPLEALLLQLQKLTQTSIFAWKQK